MLHSFRESRSLPTLTISISNWTNNSIPKSKIKLKLSKIPHQNKFKTPHTHKHITHLTRKRIQSTMCSTKLLKSINKPAMKLRRPAPPLFPGTLQQRLRWLRLLILYLNAQQRRTRTTSITTTLRIPMTHFRNQTKTRNLRNLLQRNTSILIKWHKYPSTITLLWHRPITIFILLQNKKSNQFLFQFNQNQNHYNNLSSELK